MTEDRITKVALGLTDVTLTIAYATIGRMVMLEVVKLADRDKDDVFAEALEIAVSVAVESWREGWG